MYLKIKQFELIYCQSKKIWIKILDESFCIKHFITILEFVAYTQIKNNVTLLLLLFFDGCIYTYSVVDFTIIIMTINYWFIN